MGGVWGAVCEYHFEAIDAAVACGQLNLSTESKHKSICLWY